MEPLSLDEVAKILEADFGAAAREVLHTMRSTPFAADAVGQSHRSTLSDGTPIAIKVQRPGIAEREACDFALAAQRQERIWWLFAGHGSVVVPSLRRNLCSARVITSDFVSGVPLDKYLATGPNQEARDRAGEALFDFYVGLLFEHGLYGFDPDPQNQLFLPDGRVAFLDFTWVRDAAPAFVAQLALLTHSLLAGETPAEQQAPASAELVFVARAALGLATAMAQLGARANFRQRLHALLSGWPQPSFDVVLVHPGDSAITMARALLDATGLPLREIEQLIKRSPQTIKQAIPRAEAEALRVRLEQAGAQIAIKLV